MAKLDEREVLRRAERLGQINPTSETTRRAIERTRLGLTANGRLEHKRFITRTIIPTSIAAAILMVLATLFIAFPQERVSATELLKEVAEVNGVYKGWVHLTIDRLPKVKDKEAPKVKSWVEHFNTADGTEFRVVEFEGRRRITSYVPSRGEQIEYNSKTDEIRIGVIHPNIANALGEKKPTLTHLFDSLRQATGTDAFEIKRTREGKYDRFDIRLADDADKSDKLLRNWKDKTVWVDPATKLIHKVKFAGPAGGEFVVTYGEPIIKDIYDLGVPRDAKVIDNRPKPNVKAVLDRTEARIEKGFGDCVAVLTETLIESGGKPNNESRSLQLFIQNGNAWLFNRYAVGDRVSRVPVIKQPAGWPTPTADSALQSTRSALPEFFFVTDGKRAWQGYYNDTTRSYDGLGELKGKFSQIPQKGQFSLAAEIWPTRDKLQFHRPVTKVELLTAPDRPGQVALYASVSPSQYEDPESGRREQTRWIDPGRDDMPMEYIQVTYQPDGKTVWFRTEVRYLDHAQLPNGQWYPTRWQTKQHISRLKGRPETSRTCEYYLRIYPDVKVDKDWFTNPAERIITDSSGKHERANMGKNQ